jgi:hypothetical protein
MKFIGIGLFTERRRAIVVGERSLNGIGIVHEVEDENVVLLLPRAIQSRKRLLGLSRVLPCAPGFRIARFLDSRGEHCS